jgi:tetratricopeptide (TPR) repeat protein
MDFMGSGGSSSSSIARLAALEQLCLACLDVGHFEMAELALQRLVESGVPSESSRRLELLRGRVLEAAGEYDRAETHYRGLLADNPANLLAMKRLYCVHRAQVGGSAKAMDALNSYLEQNYNDSSAWHEMANLRQEMGDFLGAAYALEEALMMAPSDAAVHVRIGECLATADAKSVQLLRRARQHMAQALELDPANRRAQMGLVCTSNAYLVAASLTAANTTSGSATAASASVDDHDASVAKELVKYGADQVLQSYRGSPLFSRVQKLMAEYTNEPVSP